MIHIQTISGNKKNDFLRLFNAFIGFFKCRLILEVIKSPLTNNKNSLQRVNNAEKKVIGFNCWRGDFISITVTRKKEFLVTSNAILHDKILNDAEKTEVLELWQDKINTITSGVAYAFLNNPKTQRKGDKVARCGNFLEFSRYANISTGELKSILSSANFCNNRWCLMCQSRKVQRILAENLSIVNQALQEHNLSFLMLTLTLSGEKPLNSIKTHLKTLSDSFKRLQEYPDFKKAVFGYFRGVEFMGDRTKSGYCHPHYHILLAVKPSYFTYNYIKHERWLEMWRKASRDYANTSLNICKIKPKKSFERDNETQSDENIAILSALCEVIKYSVSPAKLAKTAQKGDLIKLDELVRGSRQYARGGMFKKYKAEFKILSDKEWELINKVQLLWTGDSYVAKC